MKKAYKIFIEERELIDSHDVIDPELVPSLFGLQDSLEQEQLMALITIVKNDNVLSDPLLFENIVLILNGVPPEMVQFDGTTPSQIWYAVFILSKLRPDFKLSEIVKAYIEFIHSENGFFVYPRETGIKTPIKENLMKILELKDNNEFSDFNFNERQASMLSEVLHYMDKKIEEDKV